MSNRNFNASVITQRMANKAVAKNILSNMQSGNPYFFQPQSSNFNTSVINQVELGNSMFVSKGTPCVTIDAGCPCFSDVFITQNITLPLQWATFLSGTNNVQILSVKRDSNNNIYITGSYASADVVIVQNVFGAEQIASQITLPPSIGTNDVFLIKYNSDGIAQWATILNGFANDIGYSLAIDSSDSVYITGRYSATSIIPIQEVLGNGQTSSNISLPIISIGIFLIKYNSDGKAQWATIFNSTTVVGPNIGYSLAIDSSDNVYITGQYASTVTITVQNSVTSGIAGTNPTNPAITLPSASASGDVFLIKYNSSGAAIWATNLKGISADIGYSLGVDSADNIYVTGQYLSSNQVVIQNGATSGSPTPTNPAITLPILSSSSVFLIKYTSGGLGQWATYLNGSNTDIGFALAIDSGNNIYITGQYLSTNQVIVQDVLNNGQTASNITLPATGSVIGTFLIQYSSSGKSRWATILNGDVGPNIGYSLAIDSSDNVYMTGQYSSSNLLVIQNGNGNVSSPFQMPSNIELPISSNPSAIVIKYNSNGKAQNAVYFVCSGGTTGSTGRGIILDSNNNIYVGGLYASSSDTAKIYKKDVNNNKSQILTLPITTTINISDGFLIKYQ